ncbi:hypothetical protein [Clostridium tunisiense]|uniref:hypothetical protein n=1 Tax=Clostridium tunisiense TaxID=219748 RepID=UPI000301E81E|nr:hypothetical protein [Clostridium tunisiense]
MNILSEITKLILNGDYTSLIWLILLALFIFLFKEFKKSNSEIDELTQKRADSALEVYSKALAALVKCRNNAIDKSQLIDSLYAVYPFTAKDVIIKINDLIKSEDTKGIIEVIQEEILRVKSLQRDNVSYQYSNKAVDLLSNIIRKYNISSLVTPLILAISSVLILLISFGLLTILAEQGNFMKKVILIILIIGITINFLMYLVTIDVLSEKNFKLNLFTGFMILLFAVNNFLPVITTETFFSFAYIINTFIYAAFMIYKIFNTHKNRLKEIRKEVT